MIHEKYGSVVRCLLVLGSLNDWGWGYDAEDSVFLICQVNRTNCWAALVFLDVVMTMYFVVSIMKPCTPESADVQEGLVTFCVRGCI